MGKNVCFMLKFLSNKLLVGDYFSWKVWYSVNHIAEKKLKVDFI